MSEVKNEIINRLTKLNGTTEVDETSEEIKQISKRFNNGTETIDDILNHCRHYMLKLENGRILDLVEKKYLDTVLNLIEKLKKENEELKKYDYRSIKIDKRNEIKSPSIPKEKLDIMNLGISLYLSIPELIEDESEDIDI